MDINSQISRMDGAGDGGGGSSLFWDVFAAMVTNGHIYRCNADTGGKLTDSAKGYDPVHATHKNTSTTTPHPTDPDKFDGLVDVNATNDRIEASLPLSETSKNGSDRTFLILFNNDGNDNNHKFLATNLNTHHPGFIWAPAGFGSAVVVEDEASTTLATLDTTHSHTDGGSSEKLASNESGILLVAMCWDLSELEFTIRWKSTSQARTGHSYRAGISSTDPGAPAGSAVFKLLGYDLGQSFHGEFLGAAIADHFITASQFNDLCNAAGLSGT